MIILTVLITGLTPLQLSSLSYEDFQKKSEYEKWVYFDTALNEAKRYKTAFLTQKEITKKLFCEVTKRDKEIFDLSQKNFKPRWGISFGIKGSIDSQFDWSIDIVNNYYVYFLKRFFISPNISFNFGKNLNNNNVFFGGGIGFNFGIIFEQK